MMGSSNNNNSEELTHVVQELLAAQNVDTISKVDCSKVSSEQFAEVGDAWMDGHIDNKTAHEQMDQMMGGEGSESLTAMHVRMGENYLGCTTNNNGSYTNMMGNYGYGMMGYGPIGFSGGLYSVFGFATWVLLIVFLIAGIRYFWTKGK